MKTVWTRKMVRAVKKQYATCESLKSLAAELGVSVFGLRSKANALGFVRRGKDFYWTAEEDAILRAEYAETPMEELVKKLHRSQRSIWQRAQQFGLRRSEEFIRELGRKSSQHPKSIAARFKKGFVPFNKGKKEQEFRSQEAIERCRTTQFKPGHRPHNARPEGYESVRNGNVYIKVKGESRMRPKHRYVWEQHYGPVPEGMCVTFRDGNKLNCSIENLLLITESEKATRVTESMSPEQERLRVERSRATRNESIRKDKMRIRWGLEPKTRLVKRYYEPESINRANV